MKTLEQGKDKIKKICNALREETLEPAKKEAEEIVAEAHKKASAILAQTEKEAEQILKSARDTIEQEKNVFHSSLLQSSKQSLEALRQAVEFQFFNEQLHEILKKNMSDSKVVAELISAIVKGIEKQGLETDLRAIIAQTVSADEVNHLLVEGILNKLKDNTVVIGKFSGGVKIRLNEKNIAIEITDETLRELLAGYMRKDFRKLVFNC